MRYVFLFIVAALVWAAPAGAQGLAYKVDHKSLASIERGQKKNLVQAMYVCTHGRGYPKTWSCKAKRWLARELNETRAMRERLARPHVDSCTMEIIRREASGFRPDDPSTWYRAAITWNGGAHAVFTTESEKHGGSGAYGVAQALYGDKMAWAGADWRTNPWTQIKWMISYMNGRYGSSCGALSYWNGNGYY